MDAGAWAVEHAALFESLGPEEAAKRIELWRAAAAEASGLSDVELAGPFQRHFTARGTGVPSNLCLVLTPTEVHAHKLDPAHADHPLYVGANQISERAASWPRGSVRATAVEPGRMAWGVTFEVDGAQADPLPNPEAGRKPGGGDRDLGARRRAPVELAGRRTPNVPRSSLGGAVRDVRRAGAAGPARPRGR